MQFDAPHACDVNVALQRRMNDDMDTCAFTARQRDDDGAAAERPPRGAADDARAGAMHHRPLSPPAEWPLSPPSFERRERELESSSAMGFPPTWAIALAIAVALAAVAYSSKWR